MYEEYTGDVPLENLRPSSLVFDNSGRRNRLGAAATTPLFEVAASTIGLVLGAT